MPVRAVSAGTTGATKRYPRRATVCTYCGDRDESPSVCRSSDTSRVRALSVTVTSAHSSSKELLPSHELRRAGGEKGEEINLPRRDIDRLAVAGQTIRVGVQTEAPKLIRRHGHSLSPAADNRPECRSQ